VYLTCSFATDWLYSAVVFMPSCEKRDFLLFEDISSVRENGCVAENNETQSGKWNTCWRWSFGQLPGGQEYCRLIRF